MNADDPGGEKGGKGGEKDKTTVVQNSPFLRHPKIKIFHELGSE